MTIPKLALAAIKAINRADTDAWDEAWFEDKGEHLPGTSKRAHKRDSQEIMVKLYHWSINRWPNFLSWDEEINQGLWDRVITKK